MSKRTKLTTPIKWFVNIKHLPSSEDKCVICQDELTDNDVVSITCCSTLFHQQCATEAFRFKPQCPVCRFVMEPLIGSCPPGTMTHKILSSPNIGGTVGCIEIHYNIPSGIQRDNHPSPGIAFAGTSRRAYLPNDEEGRKVLALLKRAFDAKLTFTIGTSLTTGEHNVVTWAGIHHKTSFSGTFGYPDPLYLERVQIELKAKGIF